MHAIRRGVLEAEAVYEEDYGRRYLDLRETTIHVGDLDHFVKSNGFECPFFERSGRFFDPDPTERAYPPKLAAALKAWNAVNGDEQRLRGKTPKMAVEAWLRENAEELKLLRRDGAPNETAIEEISKVVNWKPEGGVPATPGAFVPTTVRVRLPDPSHGTREDFSADLDDEIPF